MLRRLRIFHPNDEVTPPSPVGLQALIKDLQHAQADCLDRERTHREHNQPQMAGYCLEQCEQLQRVLDDLVGTESAEDATPVSSAMDNPAAREDRQSTRP